MKWQEDFAQKMKLKKDHIRIDVDIYEEDWQFTVWQKRMFIGHANCHFEHQSLCICFIEISDAATKLWPLADGVRVRLGIAERKVNCRGKDFGSQLLKRILLEADARNVREVWGEIVQGHLDVNPDLLRWYERNGFAAAPPDETCMPEAVWKIVRRHPLNPV